MLISTLNEHDTVLYLLLIQCASDMAPPVQVRNYIMLLYYLYLFIVLRKYGTCITVKGFLKINKQRFGHKTYLV